MSESSPDDLVVAFRSMQRRRREALAPVDGDQSVAPAAVQAFDRAIAAAAQFLRLAVGADAAAVATEIASRHTDEWAEATLDDLRGAAIDAGRALRDLADAAERAADRR